MNPYWLAGLLCAMFAVLEALCAGRGVARFMQELKQPRWSLPLPLWYLLGLLYYAACYVVLVRILRHWPTATIEFWLLVFVMAINAGWNYFFFRRRDFASSFRICMPYGVFVLLVVWRTFAVDSAATWLLLAYVLYLPYSLFWTYRVWKLNADQPAIAAAM